MLAHKHIAFFWKKTMFPPMEAIFEGVRKLQAQGYEPFSYVIEDSGLLISIYPDMSKDEAREEWEKLILLK